MSQSRSFKNRQLAQRRRSERTGQLDVYSPTRRCPCCGKLKLASKALCVVPEGEFMPLIRGGFMVFVETPRVIHRRMAVCRSCLWKARARCRSSRSQPKAKR